MTQPNFIVFLTDDQGYGDLSCMGATDFRTPRLDRLAADGVRFTDWYSNSPVCSPSRASLLTGRYPGNAGVRSILAGHRTATGLPQSAPTLATHLKAHGYNTYMSGKWHLGLAEGSRPGHHGFDHWYGHMAGCIDYYSHIFYWGAASGKSDPTHDLWEDDQEIWQNGEYFTESIADKAIAYIRDAHAKGKPFFLYVPFNAPHYPMHAPQQYIDRFPDLPWDRQIMAAMISAVDDAVGAIMDEVERLGMDQDTCSFFTSDNGPSRETRNWLDGTRDPYYGGTAGKLKGHKFSLYEGGVRMPALMHWPAGIKSGQVLSDPCASMDIVPTFLSAAGVDASDKEIDGSNLLPYLQHGESLPERTLYWEMGKQTAVRRGNHKLVLKGQLVEDDAPNAEVWLSDLGSDMSESTNIADDNPELTQELTTLAESWRQGIETRWENEFTPKDSGIVTHK